VVTVLFNIVPQAAIEAFQSQYQLPMTPSGSNIRANLREEKKKMTRKMAVEQRQDD
jgi:hypothetical protein